MTLSIGIIGLPGVGKTALFSALTARHDTGSRGRSNFATVPVPDARLDALADMIKPKKLTPAGIQFVDVGGLAAGSSREGGLGAQFLGQLQGVNALAVVVRAYEGPDLGFGAEPPQPREELEAIMLELKLSDMARIEKRLEATSKAAKGRDPDAQHEEAVLRQLHEALDAGRTARRENISAEDEESLKDLALLTLKPMIVVANVAEETLSAIGASNRPESQAAPEMLTELEAAAKQQDAEVAIVCAQLEAELAELEPEEAAEYLQSLGVESSGLSRFVQAAYRQLGLITFFTTTGEKEVRAWTVPEGTRAPQAAGQIHSDMERGFIRAEVTPFERLAEAGSPARAKELGYSRLEGKDYVIQEGDVVHIRFGV